MLRHIEKIAGLLCFLYTACGDSSSGSSFNQVDSPFLIHCSDLSNQADKHCNLDTADPGSIGDGPSVGIQAAIVNSGSIGGGFIDGNRLIVAVWTSELSMAGYIMAVDLDSGNRTVISGQYYNNHKELQPGGLLNHVRDVQPGPNGTYYTIVWGEQRGFKLLSIDPQKNGAQALVWDSQINHCMINKKEVPVYVDSLASDPDGKVYLATQTVDPNHADPYTGIVKIENGKCQPVSYNNLDTATPPLGSGPPLHLISGLRYNAGSLWAINSNLSNSSDSASLVKIDPNKGDRMFISGKGNLYGSGASNVRAERLFYVDESHILTSGGYSPMDSEDGWIVSVDSKTMTRTGYRPLSGVAALDYGLQKTDNVVWQHPKQPYMIVSIHGGALAFFDPVSQDSYVFSY